MISPKSISTKLFAQLRSTFGNELHPSFEVKTYKKGEFVYQQGQMPKGVYFMKYGWIKIFKLNTDNDEVVLRILGNNELVGYVPLIKQCPYANYAQAIEYSELYFIPRKAFYSLISNNIEFAQLLIQLLCDEVYKAEDQIFNLHSKKIDKRLATLLLGLEQASEDDTKYADSYIRIPKKDLAKIINVSPETLSRYLRKFQNKGLVESEDGAIKVMKKEELSRISNIYNGDKS